MIRSRSSRGRLRMLACGAAGLLAACTSNEAGSPQAHRVPGTIQSAFLGLDEVSALTGTELTVWDTVAEPPAALASEPATCAVAVGPATQVVYARGWTAFRSETYQDVEETGDNTVTVVVGVYADNTKAGAVFRTLDDGLRKGCAAGAIRTDTDGHTSKWTYKVDQATSTPGVLSWVATQEDGNWWACYRQARLKDKAVLQVAVCEAGDATAAVAALADRFAEKVGG